MRQAKIVRRVLLRLFKAKLGSAWGWWWRLTRELRRVKEARKRKMEVLVATFKRIVHSDLTRSFNTWAKLVEWGKFEEVKRRAAVALMKKSLTYMANKELTYGFREWAGETRRIRELTAAAKVFERRTLGHRRSALKAGFHKLRNHTNLLFEVYKSRDLKLKGQGIAVEILVRWIRRIPGSSFMIWKLKLSAAKKKEEMCERAATMVVRGMLRGLKASLSRAFDLWTSIVGSRKRLEFIVKRFMLNRSMSLAWGRWMFFLDGVQLAKDKKARCCQMIKSVMFHRMGMEIAHAFHHWSVQRLDARVRDGKMRVLGSMLAEKLKKWQYRSVNAAVQLWKKVAIFIAQRETALRLVVKTLEQRMQRTLSGAWKSWKYQLQSTITADRVKAMKDKQLSRVVNKWRTRKLGKGFFTWQINAQVRLQKIHVMTKVISSISRVKVAAAFANWQRNVTRLRHEEVCKRMAARTLKRLGVVEDYKKISKSWRTWREFVMREEVAFSKALAANPQGVLKKAVEQEEVKMKMHFTRKAATRVIRRWSQAKAWDAFLKWKEWNKRQSWKETVGLKMIHIIERMMGRRVKNRMKVSWWVWKLHSETVGRRRRDRKYGGRMVVLILKDGAGKRAAKAFIRWKDWMRSDRELETVKGVNTAKFLSVCGTVLMKVLRGAMWARFVFWKMKVSQMIKYERGISVVGRMMKRGEARMLVKGWAKWVDVWKFEMTKRKVLKNTVLRMQRNSKATTWGVFKRQCAHMRFHAQKEKFKKEAKEWKAKSCLVRSMKMGKMGAMWRWKLLLEECRRKEEGAKRTARWSSKWSGKVLRAGYDRWADFTLFGRSSEQNRRQGGGKMAVAIRRMLRKELRWSWMVWQKFCWGGRVGMRVIAGVLTALTKRSMAAALRKWRDVVKLWRGMVVLSLSLKRLRRLKVWKGWRTWAEYVVNAKAAESKMALKIVIMTKVVKRLNMAMLWNGFGRFARVNKRVKATEVLRRVGGHWKNRR